MDIDVQDTASDAPAPDGDRSSRRRLLGAGVAGLAASLLPQLGARAAASTDTTPGTDGPASQQSVPGQGSPEDSAPDNPVNNPTEGSVPATDVGITPTTTPPKQPTDADVELLKFAQTVELAAVSLYDTALRGGALTDQQALFTTLREAHLAYGQSLGALVGKVAPDTALSSAVDTFSSGFGGSVDELLSAAYDLEATAVATHTDLIGQLQGTDGAALVGSIVLAEARHCTVLADLAGQTDLDVLLTSDADALAPTKG